MDFWCRGRPACLPIDIVDDSGESNMSIHIEEQEQIEALKSFWDKYGTFIIASLIMVLAIMYGWRYWQNYKVNKLESASSVYMQMTGMIETGKEGEAKLLAEHLMKDYKNTAYASLAALMLGKKDVLDHKLDSAETSLKWVMQNGSQKSMRQLATIRLAKIFLEEKKAQQAIDVLKNIDDNALLAEVYEVKADAMLLLGKRGDAISLYKNALELSAKSEKQSPLLAMKLKQLE